MATKLFFFGVILPFVSFAAFKISLIDVDPSHFPCHHQKQIKGDLEELFDFLVSPHALEKLLPWMRRLREADKRIIAVGKSYKAELEVPLFGGRTIYVTIIDYKPSKLIVFEVSNDFLKQKIIIQLRGYHDRVLLITDIHFRRNSVFFHIGYFFRRYLENRLKNSMQNVANVFESLDGFYKIPNISQQ
ncbi:uncharacterized protein LOC106651411 [Trichogramma pretiosum]|uniref:uncharacterized protein LOC106651411 n=1 Tax=Trichogramma pretiosum TaxID=7493 RepID=UPI0006C9BED3|nr:uncharacterized protein LOC106651411 [Trichogramma pretiosum]